MKAYVIVAVKSDDLVEVWVQPVIAFDIHALDHLHAEEKKKRGHHIS